jgi:pantoate kinase
MQEAVAFAPCHITGVFQIFDKSDDKLKNGSKGAGVSLNMGVETRVKVERESVQPSEIYINGHLTDSATVSKRVIDIFLSRYSDQRDLRILVAHCTNAPIGAGFGTSGAAALSLALALNEAMEIHLSQLEAAQVAHVAEVECKTGLGTVIAETFGGFEIRIYPGAPGIGKIRHLTIPDDRVVACHVFGPLSTKQFLNSPETRTKINKFGGQLIANLASKPTVSNFMKISREFAENVGLITQRVRQILNASDKAGFVCSMPMFGEGVFTVTDKRQVDEILQTFEISPSNGQTILSNVDYQGARVIK